MMGTLSKSHDRSDDQEKSTDVNENLVYYLLEEQKLRRLIALEISSSLEACDHARRRLPWMVTSYEEKVVLLADFIVFVSEEEKEGSRLQLYIAS